MRNLKQNASAITGIGFAAAGTAMVQIYKDRQRLFDNFMGLFAFNINDKTNPAAVFLKRGIVKPLLLRCPRNAQFAFPFSSIESTEDCTINEGGLARKYVLRSDFKDYFAEILAVFHTALGVGRFL